MKKPEKNQKNRDLEKLLFILSSKHKKSKKSVDVSHKKL